ncbi:MAG: polysaccharide deacetylase [Thermaerobacter sp.]|nr:polysaccharide deacetylase [Thermaerobacter sp.]
MSGTVCLTFDFDSFAGALPGGSPGDLARAEFAAAGVPRILNLLEHRAILSTWFIPGHTVQTYPALCRDIVRAGHEVALHGYAHENNSRLTAREERQVTRHAFEVVADLLGEAPKGARTPSWDLSAATLDILTELGLDYDSSLMAHDYRPYFVRQGDHHRVEGPSALGNPSPLVELPISWSLDDWPAFETNGRGRPLQNARLVFENWRDDVVYMLRDFQDGVVTFTSHPEVTGRGHRLLGYERLVDELRQMGVAFARMDSVVQAFLAGQSYGEYRPEHGSFRERPPGGAGM